MIVMSEVS